jgi:hypothetical protein
MQIEAALANARSDALGCVRHMAKKPAFPFDVPPETPVIVCKRVAAGKAVLEVAHDDDGSWQFLCGGDHSDEKDAKDGATVMPFAELFALDSSLAALADLACNEAAQRSKKGAAWKRHDQTEDTIRDAVEEHGWFVALIPPGESADEPGFAYTVGLHQGFEHPELICLGLDLDMMHALLNACGERIAAGESLPVDVGVPGIIEDLDVRFRSVEAEQSYRDHVGYAIWYNGGHDFPLLQLLWPDKKGKFPGDKGAAAGLKKAQPLLP